MRFILTALLMGFSLQPALANPVNPPSICAVAVTDSPLLLTDLDDKQSSFASPETLYQALADLLKCGRDGKIVLSYEGRQIVIIKTGQDLMVDSGEGPKNETVAAYLILLDEARQEARIATCHNNLNQIRKALLTWKQDHDGNDPSQLSDLTPYYLKTIPTCPFGEPTSSSYELQGSSNIPRCIHAHGPKEQNR